MTDSEKLPVSVSVVGWVYLAMGILFLMIGTLNAISFTFFYYRVPDLYKNISNITSDPFYQWIIHHFLLYFLGVFSLGGLSILFSIFYLKMKRWGKYGLECITCILILYFLYSIPYSLHIQTDSAKMFNNNPPPFFHQFQIVSAIMAIGSFLFIAILLAGLLYYLHTPKVKQYFS